MDDRVFLHDNERLLVNIHPSKALLMTKILWGLVDGILIALVVTLVGAPIIWFMFQDTELFATYLGVLAGIVIVLGPFFAIRRRYKQWKKSSFRVTTDRILVQYKQSMWKDTSKTLKWPQYQESKAGKKSFFDFFFGTRPLTIRYGSADTQLFVHVPSIPYATDVKHYLDKVDSAVRHGTIDQLREFVLKKRGERDSDGSEQVTVNR